MWNWLTRAAADEVRLASLTVPSSARVVAEVAERQRSVDGLNSWQCEQVRHIVREEIAALLPALMSTPHPAPPPHRDGSHLPPVPLGRGDPDASQAYLA